jgi:hypothetical protein
MTPDQCRFMGILLLKKCYIWGNAFSESIAHPQPAVIFAPSVNTFLFNNPFFLFFGSK